MRVCLAWSSGRSTSPLASRNYGPSLDRDFGIQAAVVGKAGARFMGSVEFS